MWALLTIVISETISDNNNISLASFPFLIELELVSTHVTTFEKWVSMRGTDLIDPYSAPLLWGSYLNTSADLSRGFLEHALKHSYHGSFRRKR